MRYFTNFRHLFTPRLAWGMIVGCWLFWVAMSLLSVILAIPVERAPCYLGGGYYKTWYLVLYASIYFCHLTLVVYFQLGYSLAHPPSPQPDAAIPLDCRQESGERHPGITSSWKRHQSTTTQRHPAQAPQAPVQSIQAGRFHSGHLLCIMDTRLLYAHLFRHL